MAHPKIPDSEFLALYKQLGPVKLGKQINSSKRAVMLRRQRLEDKYGQSIAGPNNQSGRIEVQFPQRASIDIKNGEVLIGSDAHLWPGDRSLAQRAFLKFAKERKPKAVILNGDVLDFPQISRHAPIGWEKHPTVQEEIEHAQDYLHELEMACGRGVQKIWCLGNHDARFATRLASVAPEYAKVNGLHLKDHFPNWQSAWSAWINNSVVVKHRFKGGIHATHNNTIWAGKTIVTGHLHSAKVTPFSDYNGDRYGVDTGCLADVNAQCFTDYTEDNPKNWRSAFGLLTFRDGALLPPEIVTAWDSKHVAFRGELIRA